MKATKLCVAALVVGLVVYVVADHFVDKKPSWSSVEIFKTLYTEKAAEDPHKDYGFMNIEQLDGMVSSTVGTVIDTDELTVDVMGGLISGNAAEIVLRVTANELETILYDTGLKHLNNYQFHDDCTSLINYLKTIIIRRQYFFGNQDKRLNPNQYVIRYSIIGEEKFGETMLTIELKDFGYFDFDQMDQFESIYNGTWSLDIAFDPVGDTSKTIVVNEDIRIDEYKFTVDEIMLTPLSCTVSLTCHEDDRNPYIIGPLYDSFAAKSKDCIVSLADGTVLNSEYFDISPTGGGGDYDVVLSFDVPILVENIASVTILGNEYTV